MGWCVARDFLPKDGEEARVTGLATGLGCAVVASLVGFIGVGLFLDQWLGTTPILTLTGVALGLIAAGYQLYELVQISGRSGKHGPLARTMAQRMQSHRDKIERGDRSE